MTEIKSEKVPSAQLFCILFTVRLSSLFLSEDVTLLYAAFQLVLTFVLSALACIVSARMKGEIKSKAFLFLIAVTVCVPSLVSLLDFKNKAVAVGIPVAAIVLIFVLAIGYSSSLGLCCAARLAPVCAAVLLFSVAVGFFGNLSLAKPYSIPPSDMSKWAFGALKCLDAPALILILKNKTRADTKSAFLSVICSYGCAFFLFLMCAFRLREAAGFYPYPVFALFQLARAGDFDKLDIVFTVSLTVAEYLKYTVFFSGVRR